MTALHSDGILGLQLEDPELIVSSCVKGSASDTCGVFLTGDKIMFVNGQSCEGMGAEGFRRLVGRVLMKQDLMLRVPYEHEGRIVVVCFSRKGMAMEVSRELQGCGFWLLEILIGSNLQATDAPISAQLSAN